MSAEYHVMTTGNDDADGSSANPWRTLGHAASTAVAGDVVAVHSGTWNERLRPANSGTDADRITFRAAPDAEPILDGTGLVVGGTSAMIDLSDRSYVRIEGFTVQDYHTSVFNDTPIGILVQGSSSGIEIVDNVIQRIASTATVDVDLNGRNAHGILVECESLTPITDVVIRGNELKDLTLGSSEALVVNGNVSQFVILNNHVHRCDNIGIDAIGFEGPEALGNLDQARDGHITGNLVHNCTSASNPSYAGDTSAGGIYVDGGRDIVIARNHVHACDIGIELASEHVNQATSNITVRSNLVQQCLMGGLFMGGYANADTGSTEDCVITHNTFIDNDTDPNADEYGQIYLQFRVLNCVIANNILIHNPTKHDGFNTFVIQWNTTGSNLTLDRNLYHGPATPVWVLNNSWIDDWDDFHTGLGAAEHWGDPDLDTNTYVPNLNSPAIDAGNASHVTVGERDRSGNERSHGSAPDCGCHERNAAAVSAPLPTFDQSTTPWRVQWPAVTDGFCTLEMSDDLGRWKSVAGAEARTTAGERAATSTMREFYRTTLY